MPGPDVVYGPWLLVVGLVVLAAGLGRLAAFRSGWDRPLDVPRGRITDPPEPGRPPAVAGRLATRRSTGSLGGATLIDLAQRGVVRFSDATGAARWLGRSFAVHLVTEPAALLDHERALLDLVFGPTPRASEAKMSNVQRLLASRSGRLGRALNDDMRGMRLVDGDRLAARRSLVIAGLLLLGGALLAVIAAIVLADEFGGWSIALPASVAIVAIACAGVAATFSVFTAQGTREAAAWRAFGAHLKTLTVRDPERTTVVPPHWLPLAVATGHGPEWAKQLVNAGGPRSIPVWFESAEPGARADGFLALIDVCSNKTHDKSGESNSTNHALGAAIAGG